MRKRASSRTPIPASVPHQPLVLAWLKAPANAAAYIDAVLDEGDPAALLQALRNVIDARGGIARIAKKTGLGREALDRTLSKRSNPPLRSLMALLGAMGLRLTVAPSTAKVRKAA